jgi:Holliday junction resolvase RusA-like endonuclease
MEFIVEGKPQGKARARTYYDKRAGKMRSFTPDQTKSYEDLIRWSYKSAGGQYMGEATLQVDIQAHYPVPKSWNRGKTNEAVQGITRPTVKPDCDNIAKSVCDALNGVAYTDDRLICRLDVRKQYGTVPMVVVIIRPR